MSLCAKQGHDRAPARRDGRQDARRSANKSWMIYARKESAQKHLMPPIPRTKRLALVLSPPERDGLRYLAEMEGLAEADVLRRLLRLAINDLPAGAKEAIQWPALPGQSRRNGQDVAPATQ